MSQNSEMTIAYLLEKNKNEYVTVKSLSGTYYRLPLSFVKEFDELDAKIFMADGDRSGAHSILYEELKQNFEKYRIED